MAMCALGQTSAPSPAMLIIEKTSVVIRTNKVLYYRPVYLSWNESASPNIASYNVYSGTNDDAYVSEYSVTGTNLVLTNLLRGWQYRFAESAVNGQGIESALSPVTTFSGFQSGLWMFVWNGADLIESNFCEGTSFFQVDESGVWSSPDMQSWSYLCDPGQIQFSNVITALP